MLIDDQLPGWHFDETHSIHVRATPDRVFASIQGADLAAHWIIRALMGLRMLPARLAGSRRASGPHRGLTLLSFGAAGFKVLAEDPPREIVLGIVGRFWQLRDNVGEFEVYEFRTLRSDMARAAWSFHVDGGPEAVMLTTITRVHCGDEASRRKFGRYWRLIRPFSGAIRILMLRAIRKHAEA